jgi:hypothetical protein
MRLQMRPEILSNQRPQPGSNCKCNFRFVARRNILVLTAHNSPRRADVLDTVDEEENENKVPDDERPDSNDSNELLEREIFDPTITPEDFQNVQRGGMSEESLKLSSEQESHNLDNQNELIYESEGEGASRRRHESNQAGPSNRLATLAGQTWTFQNLPADASDMSSPPDSARNRPDTFDPQPGFHSRRDPAIAGGTTYSTLRSARSPWAAPPTSGTGGNSGAPIHLGGSSRILSYPPLGGNNRTHIRSGIGRSPPNPPAGVGSTAGPAAGVDNTPNPSAGTSNTSHPATEGNFSSEPHEGDIYESIIRNQQLRVDLEGARRTTDTIQREIRDLRQSVTALEQTIAQVEESMQAQYNATQPRLARLTRVSQDQDTFTQAVNASLQVRRIWQDNVLETQTRLLDRLDDLHTAQQQLQADQTAFSQALLNQRAEIHTQGANYLRFARTSELNFHRLNDRIDQLLSQTMAILESAGIFESRLMEQMQKERRENEMLQNERQNEVQEQTRLARLLQWLLVWRWRINHGGLNGEGPNGGGPGRGPDGGQQYQAYQLAVSQIVGAPPPGGQNAAGQQTDNQQAPGQHPISPGPPAPGQPYQTYNPPWAQAGANQQAAAPPPVGGNQAAANPQLPMRILRAEIERQRDLALQQRALRRAILSNNSLLILFLACLFYIFFWPATRDYIFGSRSSPPFRYVFRSSATQPDRY